MLTGRRFRKYLLGMYGLTSLKDLVATQPIFYKTHSLDCTPAPRSVEGRASRATIQRGPFSSQRPAGCVLRPRLAPATGAAPAPRASPRRGSGGRAAGALPIGRGAGRGRSPDAPGWAEGAGVWSGDARPRESQRLERRWRPARQPSGNPVGLVLRLLQSCTCRRAANCPCGRFTEREPQAQRDCLRGAGV